jgi:hypothetical protein
MRIIDYLVVIIFALVLPYKAFAKTSFETKQVEIIYERQVHLNVVSNTVNRISFANFRVVKLIGNISSFTSVLSDSGSDLFIAPKLPEGKKIDFSALLSSGDVIDFSLSVVKSEKPYLVKLKFLGNSEGAGKSEAAKMIEAMSKGVIGKYYVQKSNKKINILAKPEIKTIMQDSYRFSNLLGTSLILQNTNCTNSLEIRADDLARSFEGIVAIFIEQGLLPPTGKTKAYIVFKEVKG